jgi:NADH-quinone oxidoreductase subunit E
MYKRRPVGEYHVGVCTNTLCAIMGGDQIFAELKEHLGVGNEETTPDGKVILEHIECNAACDYAPVMTVNWEFFDNMTPASARQLVDDLRAGNRVTPTRGPGRLCTWREASRILAGFNDDQATDGPAAGEASLVGLRIARERGWTAPEAARTAGAAEPRAGAGRSAGSGPPGSGVSPADSASPMPDKSPGPGQAPAAGRTARPRPEAPKGKESR